MLEVTESAKKQITEQLQKREEKKGGKYGKAKNLVL